MSIHQIFSSEYWIKLSRDLSSTVISAAGQIVIVIILFLVVRFAVYRLIDRVLVPFVTKESGKASLGRIARIKTLQGLAKSVARYVLGFIAAIMIMKALKVDPIPALTTASVAALAVGFGSQLLVRDVITGFFILLEDQYAVGDYVTIGGITGTVEEIGMRITKIRDDVGKLNILANGTVSQVTNHSRGSILTTVDISVVSGSEMLKTMEILNEVGEEIRKDRRDVLSAFRCEGIVAMDSAKVTLRMAGRVSAKKREEVSMDLRGRVRQRLAEEEVVIA